MTIYTGFLALDQTGWEVPPPPTPHPKVDYVDLYFKVNRHGFYQPFYDRNSDKIYPKLPAGVRLLAVGFRPRSDLADFSVFTSVTYSLKYGPGKGGHKPLMDEITRAQISKGGLYPAINPKPFPGFSYTTLVVVQEFYLKPKTFNPRIDLRLYYTSDGFPYPELKSMDSVP